MKFKRVKILLLLFLLSVLPLSVYADTDSTEGQTLDVYKLFATRGYTTPISNITDIINLNYKDFIQDNIIPTDSVGYHEDIDYIKRGIKLSSMMGVDNRILSCLVSQKFVNTEIKTAREQQTALNFINDNAKQLSYLVARYKGDYQKMLEAWKYGKSNIDYLAYRYGADWHMYLDSIDLANGEIYSESKKSYPSFADAVLHYWE